MGVYSYGYKAGKKLLQKVFKPKKTTGTEVVNPFKFKPAKTNLEKSLKDVNLKTLKLKKRMKGDFQKMDAEIEPFRRKLRQTIQRTGNQPVTQSGFNKGKDLKK
jgi:hypothetical protein|tara:strand:+ start:210 stop:521 length:312 start_codon:yes stop_codon:yes gene_type:complete